MEGFRHVIVGAKAKTADLVLDAGQTGENEDRRRNFACAKRFEDFIAAHIGEVQVKKDDVVIVQLAQIDPFFTEVGGVHIKTVRFQHQLDALSGCTIVFNEQNSHGAPLCGHAVALPLKPKNLSTMKT